MHIKPYLFFDGHCEEALDFYKAAVGAEVTTLMRFKENPDEEGKKMIPPGGEDKVMHAEFKVGDTVVMASDGNCTGSPTFSGFGLSLIVSGDAEAERLFQALGDGGQVVMPMGPTFFASRFGMVADRFGVMWMVITEQPS